MPSKMVPYRPRRAFKKASRYSHARKMRLYKNMPVSIPRPGTLLSKSQYCDFELVTLVPLITNGDQTEVRTVTRTFARFNYGTGSATQLYGFNQADMWNRIARVFEEYAIKGMRLEYVPTNYVGSQEISGQQIVNKGAIIRTFVYQDLNTRQIGGYSTDEVVKSNGFQMINPNNTFVLNLNNKPLAQSQKSSWAATVPGPVDINDSNGLPDASVAFRMETLGFPQTSTVGYLKCTWYMTARGVKPT